MATATNIAQGRVVAIIGKIIAIAPDGSERILKLGDIVATGDRLIIPADGVIELQSASGNIVRIAEARDLTITDDVFNTASGDASDAAIATLSPEAEQALAALERGQDPLQELEATAAGLAAGGGEDGGNSFTRIGRVAEGISPLSLDLGLDGGNPPLQQATTGDAVAIPTIQVGLPGIATGDVEVMEGKDAVFGVNITGAAAGSSLVLVFGNGSALSPADYAATGFQYSTDGGVTWTDYSGAIPISAGASQLWVKTTTVDDSVDEANETFALSATLSSGGGSYSDNAIATIVDNDTPVFTLSGDATVEEGSAANYKITLSGASLAAGQQVVFTIGSGLALDSATEGVDYDSVDGTLTVTAPAGGWAMGSEVANFTVKTSDDTLYDPGESYTVALEDSSIGTGSGSVKTTILDNDTPVFTLSGDATVEEGSAANYKITLSGASLAAGQQVVFT
ncbi:retention module-containing protein, partial [Vogesella indigofera]|uniref:retention module-containing protein n=1 Tax=Vogesella indigofera TaxID=45465 RepID=UPI00234F312A